MNYKKILERDGDLYIYEEKDLNRRECTYRGVLYWPKSKKGKILLMYNGVIASTYYSSKKRLYEAIHSDFKSKLWSHVKMIQMFQGK